MMAELKDQRGVLHHDGSVDQQAALCSWNCGLGGWGISGKKRRWAQIEQLLKDPVPAVRESAAGAWQSWGIGIGAGTESGP